MSETSLSETRFVPGQRWVSATEAELGLGVVEEVDGRLVVLRFPAADELRTYAVDNAPLGRVQYAVGDRVQTVDGIAFEVHERQERAGLIFYLGAHADGSPLVVPELDLDSAVRFSKPQDRLFAGQIDRNRLFELRADTQEHLHRHRAAPVFGLVGPRVQLLPHQLYIASQVAARHAPRVLLADEVGLGKTVEAGLIAHQQIASGNVRRVLVVVPDGLLHQWLVEMLRRFSLRFTLLDAERCAALEADAEGNATDTNPFDTAQHVLCPLSLLEDDDERLAQAIVAGWDMLVVDEAHHLYWQPDRVSNAYRAVQALAEHTPSVLLLTATPEQLGVDGHFARLRLLDPERYHDLDAFRAAEAAQQPLSALVDALLDAVDGNVVDASKLATCRSRVIEYLGEDAAAALDSNPGAREVEALVDRLLDRHGTGRVLFRNTRAAVGGFPRRELHAHVLDGAPPGSRGADLEQLIYPETLLGEGWPRQDARVAWLVQFLEARRSDKVLVVCALDETARALEEHLRIGAGVRSAVFHAGLGLVARDRAAAYFADAEEGAQVLVCSEVGSEGRNFQFARDLVLFDLPLEPDVLEQRIGRLDRIGQERTVRIHVPHHEDSAQAVLLRWYHEGLDALEQPCAVGDRLLEEFAPELCACMLGAEEAPDLSALVRATARHADELRAALERGRDRLVELNSCRPGAATDVVRHVLDAQRPGELGGLLERLLDHFGVEQQAHGTHSIILRPGEHMLHHSLPGLPEDGLTGTFNRAEALQREDMHFLTWEHPLVEGAMELLLDSGAGNTALVTAQLKALPPGTLLLEARFVLHSTAPRRLQVQRFLPASPVRIVCDEHGRDLSKPLSPAVVGRIVRPVPARNAHELVKHTRSRIAALVGHAEALAAPSRAPLLDAAREQADTFYARELERLRDLAAVNPAVRGEEIEHLRDTGLAVRTHIDEAGLTLDAIRVIVITGEG